MLQQIGDAIGIVAGTEARFRIGLYGRIAVEIGSLLQIADGGAGMAKDLAGLRLDHAGGDLHQGRLAGAIASDEADAVRGLDLQAGTRKPRDRKSPRLNPVTNAHLVFRYLPQKKN